MNINYVFKAIEARRQNRMAADFKATKYGKHLASLKDRHKGEKCFVIGNGPSLKAEDLQKLYEKKVISFATNRVFNIFNQTDWRPDYYISEDINVLRDVTEDVRKIKAREKFIPINLKWYEGIDIPNISWFYMDYSSDLTVHYGLSEDIAKSVRCRSTVTTTCLQFAIYMGFSEIFLIGVDHSFAKMVDKVGNTIIDETIKDHFSKDYAAGITDLGFHVDEATEAYLNVEQLSREKGTFKVYNATRGGKLEVYERADFDSVVGKL